MKYSILIISFSLFFASSLQAQFEEKPFEFKGQISGYGNYNFENDLNVLFGGNFIPQATYSKPLENGKLLDFDLSLNLNGSFAFHPFDSSRSNGAIDPYRAWTRYSGDQFEVRLGLQKINFGSATNLRPLRWFDQVDPRDPLSLTSGVWGLLGRYYFLNNANIWTWVLYGNEDPKGWEQVSTNEKIPEFGGRIQVPTQRGEIGLSYHHRNTDSRNLNNPAFTNDNIGENKIGLDGKWDVTVGLWAEASHSFKSKDVGIFTNQTLINVGTDYTFDVGNGLNMVFEHLLTSYDEKSFQFENTQNLTALTGSYPVGLFDNLSTVLYFDWESEGFYSFLNYQRDLKNFTFFAMVYVNPKDQGSIQQNDLVNNFNSKGFQLMLVYNF